MIGFDWHTRENYDYMDRLAKGDWSWECVRRNARFEADWLTSISRFETVEHLNTLEVVEAATAETSLDDWSLLYCGPPDADARAACAMWRPDCYRKVLSATALPVGKAPGVPVFSLRDNPCRSILLLRPGDRQHVVFRGTGLQLAVRGASLREPVHLMIETVAEPVLSQAQASLLECFNALRRAGHTNHGTVPIQSTRRMKTVLQVLDGSLAGASHREIATAVYGRRRVDMQWDDPREHLKDHIRKTVLRGHRLMNDRYRVFLGNCAR